MIEKQATGIKTNFRRPARIFWIGAGLPPAAPLVLPLARSTGLRRLMVMLIFVFSIWPKAAAQSELQAPFDVHAGLSFLCMHACKSRDDLQIQFSARCALLARS